MLRVVFNMFTVLYILYVYISNPSSNVVYQSDRRPTGRVAKRANLVDQSIIYLSDNSLFLLILPLLHALLSLLACFHRRVHGMMGICHIQFCSF